MIGVPMYYIVRKVIQIGDTAYISEDGEPPKRDRYLESRTIGFDLMLRTVGVNRSVIIAA